MVFGQREAMLLYVWNVFFVWERKAKISVSSVDQKYLSAVYFGLFLPLNQIKKTRALGSDDATTNATIFFFSSWFRMKMWSTHIPYFSMGNVWQLSGNDSSYKGKRCDPREKMIKETNPTRDDKGGNLISGKPLSPKHGIASPYPMILSWNIFLDIRALSFEAAMKSPSSGFVQEHAKNVGFLHCSV